MVVGDVQQYMRLVAAHPEDPWLRLKLGQSLLDRGQVDNALGELAHVRSTPWHGPRARLLAARARLALGDGDGARAELRAALPGLGGEELREAYRLLSRSQRAMRSDERTPARLPFAANVRAVVRLATEEARWCWSPVRPGHLLTALVREPGGRAGALLRSLGLAVVEARRCMRRMIEHEYPRRGAGQDLRARELLVTARRIASQRRAQEVRSEHLLEALLDTGDVPLLLQQLGSSAGHVQDLLRRIPGPRRPFSRSARAALEAAQSEVFNAGQRMVSTAHILLGLLRDGGPAGDLLKSNGLDADRVRGRLEQAAASRGANSVSWSELRPGLPSCDEATPRCRQLLRGAQRASSRSTAAPSVVPMHLLAALLELPRCIALQVISDLGVDLEVLEGQVLAALSDIPTSKNTVGPAISVEQREGPLPAVPCFAEPPVGYQRTPSRPASVARAAVNAALSWPDPPPEDASEGVGFNWTTLQAVLSVFNVVLAWLVYYYYCELFAF